ncbi:MAG: EscU/YscU/HrcU family type III secretion system export apparatus switch protein, partial [Gemmatimonadaceae bacterium]
MADSEAEKTEDATQHRRDEAREDGKIPKSPELTVAASLLGSAAVLSMLAPIAGQGLFQIMGSGLASVGTMTLDGESATTLIRTTAMHAFAATFGLIAATTGAAAVMATLQARGTLSLKPITPQFSRISPAANAKNLIGSKQVVELLKSLGKLGIVGIAVYGAIKAAIPDAIVLSQTSQLGFLFVVKKYAVRMLTSA